MSDKPEGSSLKDKLLGTSKKKDEPKPPKSAKMVEPKGMSLEEADEKLEEVAGGMKLKAPPPASGVELAAKNPNMAKKHQSILSQKPSGARKYFRSK
jgi:hypothetical protein